MATYSRRLELTSRLSGGNAATSPKTTSKPSSAKKSAKKASEGKGRTRGNSWLFGSGSETNAEALPVGALSGEELQQLEMENAEIYLRFLSERSEIQQLGSQISEIGRLQAMVTESLVEQAEVSLILSC